MKKYELLEDSAIEFCGTKLFRIRALVSFASITAGETGGYIESEKNLGQDGHAWVFGDARVSDNANVMWFSKVGSCNGTLTAFRSKAGITVTRGCFVGSLTEFEQAVANRHGDSQVGREYRLLIEFIKLRLGKTVVAPEPEAKVAA